MMIVAIARGDRSIAAIVIALLVVATPAAATAAIAQSDRETRWQPDTPEKVAIRAEIEALSIEYYYRIDHGEAERAADLFTDGGIFQPGGSKPIVGRGAIRAYYAQRPKTWVTRHVTTNLRLTYIDADHVEVVRVFTHYIGDSAQGPPPYPAMPSVGEYKELLVRGTDRRWRYASRIASAVFSRQL